MTFKEFMHTSNPYLDNLIREAENRRTNDEEFKYEEHIKEESKMIIECPINDWHCPYFKNGDCTLGKEAKTECDAWYGLEDDE